MIFYNANYTTAGRDCQVPLIVERYSRPVGVGRASTTRKGSLETTLEA
jgi:hypothetical protein